jgi:hypothetical protein
MREADLSHLDERESTIGGGVQWERYSPLPIVAEDEQSSVRVEHWGGVVAVGEAAWEVH